MSQFWDTTVDAMDALGFTAVEVLADESKLAQVVEGVTKTMPVPCTIFPNESNTIHPVDDGKSFIMVGSGEHDLKNASLSATSFDVTHYVKEVMTELTVD